MKETDIRPADLLENYLELSKRDALVFFPDGTHRENLPCPACDSDDTLDAFEKHGFLYVLCQRCGTLYQSPRPLKSAFDRFYEDSPSSNYWAETFYPQVAESRRTLIFKSRVESLSQYCNERSARHDVVVDVGAGYGIFLDEWHIRHPSNRVLAIEPSTLLAKVCRERGIETLETTAENVDALSGLSDLTTCFEVIEHVYSPIDFLCALKMMTRPGGYIVMSGLGVDGYDIQVLWQNSKSIFPPHHINFMSVKGFEALFRKAGFTDIDIFTPGKLDVEIVSNALSCDPELSRNHRFEALIASKGHQTKESFQEFLVKNRMSSHVWVIARRPKTD